jgi:hypothetical protein
MNRSREAAERFAERRRREDEAPRLRDVIPRLTACKLIIEEGRAGVTCVEVAHTRRIVVDVAPALFMIPCGDSSCRDGGHDISNDIMRGLREGRTEITGQDTCYGHTRTAECGRILKFTCIAEYGNPA